MTARTHSGTSGASWYRAFEFDSRALRFGRFRRRVPRRSDYAGSIAASLDCGAAARRSAASAIVAGTMVMPAARPGRRAARALSQNHRRGSRRRSKAPRADQQSGSGDASASAGVAALNANQKRPGEPGRFIVCKSTKAYAAFWFSIAVGPLALPPIGIERGFFASGISRTRSTCRRPFSMLAPLTRTKSASWNTRSKVRAAMP